MSKSEIALQLTLAMIEKGQYYIDDSTNESVGETVTKIYNKIYTGIQASDSTIK